ncbi:glycosyltransferase family 4 protein [Blautia schinkii]|nr:glycosyltransferase family 4 protein [Blautia schinkii]
MKILYFMNHVGQGGAALALYDLIVELKDNYDVKMVVFTGKQNQLNDMLNSIGVENYVAPYKNFMSSTHHPIWLWRVLLRIRHDICLPFAIRKIEKEVNVADFDIIHSNLNRIDIGAILAKKYNKPHLWHIREHGQGGGDFDMISVFKNIGKYMESFDNRYVAISESVKKEWEGIGIPTDKIVLIYDGVRTEKLCLDNNEHNGKIKIIFLGGYTQAKGQEMLIDSVGKLSPSYLDKIQIDFYGNDINKYKSILLEKVKKSGLSGCISLYGYDSDIYCKINQYDIGVNCSRKEGFGRVTVEYMLSGLCVIATDTGANSEIIRNQETGFLFDYGNTDELKDILSHLIDNRESIKIIGKKASEDVNANFTMKIHAKQIYQEYNRILSK